MKRPDWGRSEEERGGVEKRRNGLREKVILEQFSGEEQRQILSKRQILSSLASFIGKDFTMPVELNDPGGGWHWDFDQNVVRIDPKDLLEKPMDYLRFVISHEGGHRRVSRTEYIPLEEWKQPGFPFMMNAIEDPRVNNFVAEAYPLFGKQMVDAYASDMQEETKAKEKSKEKLGFRPRFMQAGFEYIKQWFRETQGQEPELSSDLPDDVRGVVSRTLEAARDSWLRYPSRAEADKSEDTITAYSKTSYEINRDAVWPLFKTLVERDKNDQEQQEFLKDVQQQMEGQSPFLDGLTPEEREALEEAIAQAVQKAIEQSLAGGKPQGQGEQGEQSDAPPEGKPAVIDLDSLPESLKEKIRAAIESLPPEERRKLEEQAEAALKEFADTVAEAIRGKLIPTPEEAKEAKEQKEAPPEGKKDMPKTDPHPEVERFKREVEKLLARDANAYEATRREVVPIIDALENDLREIFTERRARRWLKGNPTGKRINMTQRMQERAKGVPAVQSKAWERREMPTEEDYAITMLVDLSGSMRQDGKIQETFKAVVALSEVLNRLSIKTEIIGFNDRLYPYQSYGEEIAAQMREQMGGMLKEVFDFSDNAKANYNDDGWALRQASERLAKQKESEKFLIVLSDGRPEESPSHPRSKHDLSREVRTILEETDQYLVGLGIGPGTGHVAHYYPHSIADIAADKLPEKLATLLRNVIAEGGI